MKQAENFALFATCPKGVELLLVDELKQLGAENPREKLAGVEFRGDLRLAYKACLWSRLANRILLNLTTLPVESANELYTAVQTIDWNQHIRVDGNFAVHFVTSQSKVNHSLFGAQKVKDAIVDQFRERFGSRPDVERQKPMVSVYVYLNKNIASINIDLSGESLHKRGYRLAKGVAPMKENMAAAILMRAKWPSIAEGDGSLHDPMCGSGTILIEAAFMAGDIAPGLLREYFGFMGWKKHSVKLWNDLVTDAEKRREEGAAKISLIEGYDQDAEAIKFAFENIERAGLRGKIHVEKRELDAFLPKPKAQAGLVAVNPPYGERLGEVEELGPLYTLLGERLKNHFSGWQAAIFTGNPELGKQMGLRAKKYYSLFNGAIECQLLLFEVIEKYFVARTEEADNKRRVQKAKREVTNDADHALQAFQNRLHKNYKHLNKVAKRQGLASYVIYDLDLPNYAFKIEVVEDKIMVAEYPAPKSIDALKVEKRRNQVLAILPTELNVSPENIFFSVLPREKKKDH